VTRIHSDTTDAQSATPTAPPGPVGIGPAGGIVHLESGGLSPARATYRRLVILDHGSGVVPAALAPLGLPREGCVAIARRSMGDDVTVVDGDPLVVHLEPQPVATVRVRPEWGGERVVAVESVAVTVLSLVSRRFLDMGPSGTLHGGAVADPLGRAVLVLAASGTGKSTLVSHLVGQGFDLVNDEQVVLDGVSGMVHSFTRPVVAKVGGLGALPAGAATGRVESPGPLLLCASDLGGGQRLVAEPAVVVILDRRLGNEVRWEQLGFGAAMEALCMNNLDLSRDPVSVLDAFARLVAKVPVVRLSYEHAAEAMEVIERLMADPPSPSGGRWVLEVEKTAVEVQPAPTTATLAEPSPDGPWSWGSTVRVWSCGELVAYQPEAGTVVSVNAAGAALLWDLTVGAVEMTGPGGELVSELAALGFIHQRPATIGDGAR
jgi:hypothetical protein